MMDFSDTAQEPWEIEVASVANGKPPQEKNEGNRDVLLQRFFSELGHPPCLTSEEEHRLTSQARASWQQICTLLTQCPQLVVSADHNRRSMPRTDQLCEQDVITALERSKAFPSEFDQSATGFADFSAWLNHLQTALHTFRAARDVLVQRNLRLVLKIVHQYRNANVAQLDLLQEGVFGLMRAIEKFDPTKGFKLSTYAVWWIRQAISRALAHTSRSISLPTNADSTGTLCTATVPVTFVSLDAPIADTDSSSSLADLLPHPDGITPEEALLQGDQQKQLRHGLSCLTSQDAAVLSLRFGLTDGHTYTLEEVGRRLQMSREQVWQREERALTCLRHLFQAVDTEQRKNARRSLTEDFL
jgi:RNA polymerase sigma factor (sigma-70 family)